MATDPRGYALTPEVEPECGLNDQQKFPDLRNLDDCLYTNELAINMVYVAVESCGSRPTIEKNWEALTCPNFL